SAKGGEPARALAASSRANAFSSRASAVGAGQTRRGARPGDGDAGGRGQGHCHSRQQARARRDGRVAGGSLSRAGQATVAIATRKTTALRYLTRGTDVAQPPFVPVAGLVPVGAVVLQLGRSCATTVPRRRGMGFPDLLHADGAEGCLVEP